MKVNPFAGIMAEPMPPQGAGLVRPESTSKPANLGATLKTTDLSVDSELEKLQRETFGYFLHETNPSNGLVIDKTAPD